MQHMLDAAEAAMRFVEGRDRADLDREQVLLFALVRAIEIIGEAATKVSPSTRTALPAIPWSLIVAMRHRLVHAYFDINRDVLWTTVTEELPTLTRDLRLALGEV